MRIKIRYSIATDGEQMYNNAQKNAHDLILLPFANSKQNKVTPFSLHVLKALLCLSPGIVGQISSQRVSVPRVLVPIPVHFIYFLLEDNCFTMLC